MKPEPSIIYLNYFASWFMVKTIFVVMVMSMAMVMMLMAIEAAEARDQSIGND